MHDHLASAQEAGPERHAGPGRDALKDPRQPATRSTTPRATPHPAADFRASRTRVAAPPDPEPELSILVVSFQAPEHAVACVRSVLAFPPPCRFEILLLDNRSMDDTIERVLQEFPTVPNLVAMSGTSNLGFARANNLLAGAARGRWLLLLNPDACATPDAIARLLEVARHAPADTIFGGLTVDRDGAENSTGVLSEFSFARQVFRSLGSGWLRGARRRRRGRGRTVEVPAIAGCCCLIRRDLWEGIGGFDEGFFLFGEDLDLCLRLRRQGVRCLEVPEARFVHEGGGCCRSPAERRIRVLHCQVRLMRKHWPSRAASLGRLMLQAGVLIRVVGSRLGMRARSLRREHWTEIWRRRAEWCG